MGQTRFATGRQLDLICLGRLGVDLYAQQVGARLEDVSSFAKYLGGSSANIALIRSEPVGVMQVTVIGSSGYCASKARIMGAAAMLSPTDTACTQRPPRCIGGRPMAKRSPMRWRYAGALRARNHNRRATSGRPR